MSYPLVGAAVLTIGIAVTHSYLGERYVIVQLLRRADLPRLFGSDWFTRRTLRFAWHLTSLAWVGLAVVLLVLADHFGNPLPSTAPLLATNPAATLQAVARVVAIIFASSAVLTGVATRGRHFAWPVFSAIAALTWWGA